MKSLKSTQSVNFNIPQNSTITCAKFSLKDDQYLISGDSNNVVQLFSIHEAMPRCVFRSPSGENANSITACTFGIDNTHCYSGSFRGSINMLDIATQKVITRMNGHTTEITCLDAMESDPSPSSILASGSCDTTVKIWDPRTGQAVKTLTGHYSRINDLRISPDANLIVTSGNDNSVILWDLRTEDIVKKWDTHTAPVTCLKYNPLDLELAAAGAEKMATYYNLDTGYGIMGKTQREACAITSIEFDGSGKTLFTSSQNSLKQYSTSNFQLLGSFEMKCPGALDLKMAESDDRILSVSSKANEFSLWVSMVVDLPVSPPTDNLRGGSNNGLFRPQVNAVNVANPNLRRGGSGGDNNALDKYGDKPGQGKTNNLLDATCFMKVSESMMIGGGKSPYTYELEMIAKVQDEHSKFMDILKEKANYLKPIVHYLESNQPSAGLGAIQNIKDASIIVDIFNLMMKTNKIEGISIEFATCLLSKSQHLLSSKFMAHIKTGLKVILLCTKRFGDQVRAVKSGNVMNKVDIAREERLRKVNYFIEQLDEIRRFKRLRRIQERYSREETGKMCDSVISEIDYLLKQQQPSFFV